MTPPSADPWAFGAKFDGVTDDTRAWQSAINQAAATGAVVRPSRSGTSLIRCAALARGTYANRPEVAVYQALDINFSGLTIDLAGSTLKFIGHGTSNAVNYAFGTSKNMRSGTLRNIRIGNGSIDFDPTGDPSINKRSFYLVGVEGVFVDDLIIKSSGRRAGGTITLQNCRMVRIRNLRGLNVTQGIYLAFVEDVVLDTLFFDTFREAIDCDHKVTGLIARNLTFRNGGPTNQCIDLNSAVDIQISGISAYNVGNIAIINYKTFTPPTYESYINNEPFDSYSPSKNVTIEGVRADTICYPSSKTTVPFQLGDNQSRPDQSAFPCENITLRDVILTNCPSFIPIELVKNAVLEDFHFHGATNPAMKRGCIDIRSDYRETKTSVTLRNVTVEMASEATRGIRATAPASLELSNVVVTGVSKPRTAFFDFENLERSGATIQLEGATARAVSGAGGTAFQISGLGNNYSVTWGAGNCARGQFARQIALNGNAAQRSNAPKFSCGG